MKRAISLAVISLLAAGTAGAADLLSVYQDALANDPTIRQADALRKASREQQAAGVGRPPAADHRPGARTRAGRRTTRSPSPRPINDPVTRRADGQRFRSSSPTTVAHPKSTVWSFNLTQNLFSWTNWATLQAADSEVAQAEADYRTAQQALLQRVAAALLRRARRAGHRWKPSRSPSRRSTASSTRPTSASKSA